MEDYPIVYENPDPTAAVVRVEVWPDRKIRTWRDGSFRDPWPVLLRKDTPSLTDEEWFGNPFKK